MMGDFKNQLLYPAASGAVYLGVKSFMGEGPRSPMSPGALKEGFYQAVATGIAPYAVHQVEKLGINLPLSEDLVDPVLTGVLLESGKMLLQKRAWSLPDFLESVAAAYGARMLVGGLLGGSAGSSAGGGVNIKSVASGRTCG